jgi:hypothetical protein
MQNGPILPTLILVTNLSNVTRGASHGGKESEKVGKENEEGFKESIEGLEESEKDFEEGDEGGQKDQESRKEAGETESSSRAEQRRNRRGRNRRHGANGTHVMKLQDYRETSYKFSGTASTIARQLSFAAIGVIWLFKSDSSTGNPTLPAELFLPAALVCAALFFDLLQYVLGYLIWHLYFRAQEKAGAKENVDLPRHSPALQWPISVPFWIKIFLVFLTYLSLGQFLYPKIIFA